MIPLERLFRLFLLFSETTAVIPVISLIFKNNSHFCYQNNSGTKNSPKRKFLGRTCRGHPGVIRADIPGQNFGQGPRNPGKTSILVRTSMNILARTSMTPRDVQKLRSGKHWAEFSVTLITPQLQTRKAPKKSKEWCQHPEPDQNEIGTRYTFA